MWKKILLITVLYLNWFGAGLLAQDDQDHDQDHTSGQEMKEVNNHDDHGETGEPEDQHGDHDHDEELSIQLSAEGTKLAGIEISKITPRQITRTLELPGEIVFNEDRLVHISPRFEGIAMEAYFRVGDYVEEGDAVALIESNESMNSYTIKAPISGWVIDRHITRGEFVSGENSIYVIADLSSVWVNLAIYPKDAHRICKGQVATISAIGSERVTSGTIDFVSPIMDFQTRSATARVILPNPDNTWRPGTFIQAVLEDEGGIESLTVEKDAIQFLDEHTVVFIPEGAYRYKPVEVVTGDSDSNYTQILDGLNEGAEYVSSGAFELKAKIITSNLDAHAGHGH